MKKATVNDYFRHHWVKLMLFALFTAAVSFFAPLKNFQLKWLIDSKSKQEALGYMGWCSSSPSPAGFSNG